MIALGILWLILFTILVIIMISIQIRVSYEKGFREGATKQYELINEHLKKEELKAPQNNK